MATYTPEFLTSDEFFSASLPGLTIDGTHYLLHEYVGHISQELMHCSYNENDVREIWAGGTLNRQIQAAWAENDWGFRGRWGEDHYRADGDYAAVLTALVAQAGGWPNHWTSVKSSYSPLTPGEVKIVDEFKKTQPVQESALAWQAVLRNQKYFHRFVEWIRRFQSGAMNPDNLAKYNALVADYYSELSEAMRAFGEQLENDFSAAQHTPEQHVVLLAEAYKEIHQGHKQFYDDLIRDFGGDVPPPPLNLSAVYCIVVKGADEIFDRKQVNLVLFESLLDVITTVAAAGDMQDDPTFLQVFYTFALSHLHSYLDHRPEQQLQADELYERYASRYMERFPVGTENYKLLYEALAVKTGHARRAPLPAP